MDHRGGARLRLRTTGRSTCGSLGRGDVLRDAGDGAPAAPRASRLRRHRLPSGRRAGGVREARSRGVTAAYAHAAGGAVRSRQRAAGLDALTLPRSVRPGTGRAARGGWNDDPGTVGRCVDVRTGEGVAGRIHARNGRGGEPGPRCERIRPERCVSTALASGCGGSGEPGCVPRRRWLSRAGARTRDGAGGDHSRSDRRKAARPWRSGVSHWPEVGGRAHAAGGAALPGLQRG